MFKNNSPARSVDAAAYRKMVLMVPPAGKLGDVKISFNLSVEYRAGLILHATEVCTDHYNKINIYFCQTRQPRKQVIKQAVPLAGCLPTNLY